MHTTLGVECGGLRSPRNGVVRVRERMYSFMANYSCLRGYGLVGYPTRTCQADGRWSGRTPSCNSKAMHIMSTTEQIVKGLLMKPSWI